MVSERENRHALTNEKKKDNIFCFLSPPHFSFHFLKTDMGSILPLPCDKFNKFAYQHPTISFSFIIYLSLIIHCSMFTQKNFRTEKKKKKLTTPFNRYNSSKRFPLFELGTGVSIESSSLSFSFSSEDDDIIIFFPFVYFCCVLLTIYFM